MCSDVVLTILLYFTFTFIFFFFGVVIKLPRALVPKETRFPKAVSAEMTSV